MALQRLHLAREWEASASEGVRKAQEQLDDARARQAKARRACKKEVEYLQSLNSPEHEAERAATHCVICPCALDEPSIEYQANPDQASDDGLSIALGDCGHVFHLDCIQRWLKTKDACPLYKCGACKNDDWDFAKIEWIPGYGVEGGNG